MKKKLSKIIALLLTVASLVSMLTVFAWAEDTTGEGETTETDGMTPDFDVNDDWLYYRTYEDGWASTNGVYTKNGKVYDGVATAGHKSFIDYEEAADGNYNYFTRFEYGASTGGSPYYTYEFGTRVKLTGGYTIIGLSVKADDACEMGKILYIKLGSGKVEKPLLFIQDSKLYAFSTAPSNYICSLKDGDWCDLDIVMNWNDRTVFDAKVYVDGEVVAQTKSEYGGAGDSGVQTMYLGMEGATTGAKEGMSYCVDNLRIYQDASAPLKNIDQYGYGIFVETNAEKTVTIYKNADDKSVEQILAESLAMKLGVPSALSRNERIDISKYFIPSIVDGEVMVALDLVIDYMGYPKYIHADGASYDVTIGAGKNAFVTVGLNTATVNGELVDLLVAPGVVKNADGENVIVIAMNDIPNIFPDYSVMYDDMGLIIVYEKIEKEGQTGAIMSRDDNLDELLSIMKKFVFDTSTEKDEDAACTATGESVYEAVKANTNFEHPYIFADQATFDSIKATFDAADGNANVKAYVAKVIAEADAYCTDVTESIDTQSGTVTFKAGKEPINVYQDGKYPNYALNPDDPTVADSDDGYNPESKALYELEEITKNLVNLAFAYQMTGDSKYVYLAYAVSVALGEWVHWAPGYFINCANAASDFAVSYDWLYNAYVELLGEESVQTLASILYNQAIVHGYNSVIGEFCKFPRTAGYGDSWNTRTDSWNAICASGLIIASMAIMEYTGEGALNCEAEVSYLVGNCMINLADYGLDQYAPDGAYIESVTYWANGTNAFMKLIMALQSASGDDFGFKDTWGIEDTFYFACYIENSDGEAWNYHEDGVGSIINGDVLTVDTQMFNFAAQLLGDADLAAIRQAQIAKGKETTIFDILFYPVDGVAEAPVLKLDYYMEGLDAFVSRDSWENGALYVGLMGGLNAYSPYGDGKGDEKFGQMDSGNFIYQKDGVNWITDLGSDYYSSISYFGADRYRNYRNSGEGNNVVILTSAPGAGAVPYGQVEAGNGDMYETYIDPDGKGSYAIINNSNVYGTYSQAAYRGMLITNNKQTVVIQDEIALTEANDLAWVAHTEAAVVSNDGRVAYLASTAEDGSNLYLRATLVSTHSNLKFEELGFDEKLIKRNDITTDSRSLDGLTRLVIKANNALNIQFAVVFEQVDFIGADVELGYEWIDLNNWHSEAFMDAEGGEESNRRGIAVKTDITDKTTIASVYMDDGVAFTDSLDEFYILLADVKYVLKMFFIRDENSFESDEEALLESYEEYLDYESRYNTFAGLVGGTNNEILDYVDVLAGF